MRRALVPILLVLSGVLLLVGGLALWIESTVYDSDTFSRRAVSTLHSQAVREELADRLTAQLVKSGNQQAISFRPAFEAAIETALDTDTFRSIFRDAIRTLHADLLRGSSGSAGVNLSDSISVITGTLQLPSDARGQPVREGGFASSLVDISTQLGDLGVWELETTIRRVGEGCLIGALAAAAAAIALSGNRRRTVWWLGWVMASVGVFVVALLWVVQWYAGRRVSDPALSAAVSGGISDVTVDLRTLALWVVGYGVVLAGAAAATERLFTPGVAARRVSGWIDVRRQTTGGTLLIGLLGLLSGLLVIQNLTEASVVLAAVAGLWLTYLGTAELLRLIRRVASDDRARTAWWRPAVVVGAVLLLLGGLTAALVITTSRSAATASDVGETGCNGDEFNCDLRLDQVMFPATHNSMSSALYPGWLFGEQIGPIGDQLNAGIRALLFDTHYGIPSRSRMPGSGTPIVLTDRSRELANPEFEQADPAVVDRANALAGRAPQAANANSGIYLCHNYCELGAVSFASVLGDIKEFLDTHPDDVVIIIIQDATTPADTAAAFVDAGLVDRIATLELGQPLPTLRELIDAGTNLVVFAEDGGGGGAPPWYQPAYQGWVQETQFKFDSVDAFDCEPNRGETTGELFLVNHWVTTKGPDPTTAGRANADDVLRSRIEQCLQERGRLPNIVAVDYAQSSQLVDVLFELNQELLDEVPDEAEVPTPGSATTTTEPAPTTTEPGPTTTTAPPDTAAPDDTSQGVGDNVVITTLTGGDPGAFCNTVTDVLTSATAYAEALLTEPTDEFGLSDLAYGPILARSLEPYLDAAPQELFEQADPLNDRAQSAVAALGELGLDDRDIAALADQAAEALAAATPSDGATIQTALVDAIAQTAPPERIDEVAKELYASAGGEVPSDLFSLGFVSADVASANGYACLLDEG